MPLEDAEPDEVTPDDVKLDDVGPDDVGLDDVGPDDVGLDDVGPDDVGLDDAPLEDEPVEAATLEEPVVEDALLAVCPDVGAPVELPDADAPKDDVCPGVDEERLADDDRLLFAALELPPALLVVPLGEPLLPPPPSGSVPPAVVHATPHTIQTTPGRNSRYLDMRATLARAPGICRPGRSAAHKNVRPTGHCGVETPPLDGWCVWRQHQQAGCYAAGLSKDPP